jgi:uncharacterized protein (DUF849 family)
MQPLIINLAPTGAVPTRSDSPHVPLAPDEIGEDCGRCCALGASIVHLHAREPDGTPTYRIEIYREIIRKVRASAPDAIVCVSTTGRHFRSFEERSQVLDLEGDLKPDMASLTLGSMNFATQASVNEPAMIRALADRMRERGIVPELEVFDLGMIDYAKFLLERGVLRPPLYFNLLLGSLGTLSATPLNLALLAQALPPGSTWAAAGIGRFQFPVNALAVAMDGHVRVGLEDNLYMDDVKSRPASNLALVERIVVLGRAIGRPVATPDQAREIMGLPQREASV